MNFDINILIVEDLFTTRLFLRRTLKKLGYFNVALAEDGCAALEELKRKPFDLIISDWHMPNMDGLDLFKELTKDRKFRDIPFLLITAEKERGKVVEAVAAGIKEYIVKPVKPESLGNKIKEVVFGAA
ncbi:MAG: two-component system chemotaxis response regulator CheY [Nitrospinales bacterium]|jgi:two-component system chemotaxis response regulator CheY